MSSDDCICEFCKKALRVYFQAQVLSIELQKKELLKKVDKLKEQCESDTLKEMMK